ncbi:hypothetical protein RCL_jg6331.t1 [Rhizophagus clarus]|uniref:Uncharacterized protein n=1 Tax=Rhizophagus clarus TaxID=94130 RepID=A0A8H3QFV5_9GLOM|nr:hypothetical protein RCL_jg6331.t1 [Rhizophagus clarus]
MFKVLGDIETMHSEDLLAWLESGTEVKSENYGDHRGLTTSTAKHAIPERYINSKKEKKQRMGVYTRRRSNLIVSRRIVAKRTKELRKILSGMKKLPRSPTYPTPGESKFKTCGEPDRPKSNWSGSKRTSLSSNKMSASNRHTSQNLTNSNRLILEGNTQMNDSR